MILPIYMSKILKMTTSQFSLNSEVDLGKEYVKSTFNSVIDLCITFLFSN